MTIEKQNTLWNELKVGLILAIFGIGSYYAENRYQNLNQKLDLIIQIKQDLDDHKNNEQLLHSNIQTDIADLRKRIDNMQQYKRR